MVQRIKAININFIFHEPTESNLHLIREFYANWDPNNPDHELKVCGKLIHFTAANINELLGIPEVNPNFLKQFIILPSYVHIRHLLCGTRFSARWTRHRVTGLHSSFPYAQMDEKARMWGYIFYSCLIQGKHMMEVTRDRVCMIYTLMCDDVDINMGHVIFSAIKKVRTQAGRSFGFRGLVTSFLQRHKVDEEELDYKPGVITCPVDITTARTASGVNGPILTMVERKNRDDEILTRMYGLQMLQWTTGGRPATLEEHHVVELDYPLGHHARTLLQIGPNFVKPIDDDMPIDEERRYRDSDMESDEEDQSNDVADDDADDVDGTTEDMNAIVLFE
ncbi:hypothetical protein FXO38_05422 [Capsicum annuum]|nr:hypothetical protein FXO37_28940 [Capsicum annuum]KAF3673974.1 hypothetical protein FXO38_05422 [Capsicum annuum]